MNNFQEVDHELSHEQLNTKIDFSRDPLAWASIIRCLMGMGIMLIESHITWRWVPRFCRHFGWSMCLAEEKDHRKAR